MILSEKNFNTLKFFSQEEVDKLYDCWLTEDDHKKLDVIYLVTFLLQSNSRDRAFVSQSHF